MKATILATILWIANLYEDPHFRMSGDTVIQQTLPVPDQIPNLLFYLQRDPNSNTICYTLNLDKDGELNSDNPIKMFWVRYAEKGDRKELNYLQKKFAYGITVSQQGKDRFEIKSVAYPQRSLYLTKNKDNRYQVHTNISSKECTLSRVFIRITGGTPLSPKVEYIELHGTESATGKAVSEKVKVS